MVKIRLKRCGAKRKPFYRIVVINASSPRDGRSIEELGYYNPRLHPSSFHIDREKALSWISRGAQPTEVVKKFLLKMDILQPPKKEVIP